MRSVDLPMVATLSLLLTQEGLPRIRPKLMLPSNAVPLWRIGHGLWVTSGPTSPAGWRRSPPFEH